MKIRKAYISGDAGEEIVSYIKAQGYEPVFIEGQAAGQEKNPIGSHPDLYMCHLGPYIFHGEKELVGSSYPSDSIYNAASTGRFFIHNLSITDSKLLVEAKKLGLTLIDVKQGYTKCNTCIVDDSSIITSDAGIARACRGMLDVCLISPGSIELKGFKYGFIGGASGRIDDEIIFNGNLNAHPDAERITEFIYSRGLKIKQFEAYSLTDIGSIIAE